MEKRNLMIRTVCIAFCISLFVFGSAVAGDALRYSCSAQIYAAFGENVADQFTSETGIPLEIFPSSSRSAIYRLMNDSSDVAGSFSGLYYRQKESGYIEIPLCRDPMAVIVNMKARVMNLTEAQLKDIFTKQIANWKEVGGADQKIVVVVPDKETAAYKNFRRVSMKGGEIRYDYLAEQSRDVLSAVRSMAGSISFITQGAAIRKPGIKTIKINGLSITDENYPFYQTMYLITKGEAEGSVEKFINFFRTGKGAEIIREKGMVLIQ